MKTETTKTQWVNFLHFYLPPTSDPKIVTEAAEKSYRWVVLMLTKFPELKFTFNMNACLTAMLEEQGAIDVLNALKNSITKGQIELVDSLAYHPIAPLIDKQEMIEQIKENQIINRRIFGKKTRGFFLPEMAYAPNVGKTIAELGYHYLMLDEISHTGTLGKVDWNKKYTLKHTELAIVYRSRFWSKEYVPRLIAETDSQNLPAIIVSATDAELYGLRFVDWEGWLARIVRNPNINCITVSEYLKTLKTNTNTTPVKSNWESTETELKNNKPYELWQNKKKIIQQKLWQLANLAGTYVKQNPDDPDIIWAKRHLKQGLASCTFWWASERDFRLFGHPAWKPDEVEKGANELIRSIRTLKIPSQKKIAAEKIYTGIKQSLWIKHWKKYDKK